jgi:hypothetical protein
MKSYITLSRRVSKNYSTFNGNNEYTLQNFCIENKYPFRKIIDDKSSKIEENNILRIIINDITDYKTLTNDQLDYIKNLDNINKFQIIKIYNRIIESFINLLNN